MYLIVSYKNEIIINTYWLQTPTIIISFLTYIFIYKDNQNNCLLITIITIKFHIYTQNKREKIIFFGIKLYLIELFCTLQGLPNNTYQIAKIVS